MDLGDNNKGSNICIIRILKGESKKENWVFEEIEVKLF